jgi:hypothetical protein
MKLHLLLVVILVCHVLACHAAHFYGFYPRSKTSKHQNHLAKKESIFIQDDATTQAIQMCHVNITGSATVQATIRTFSNGNQLCRCISPGSPLAEAICPEESDPNQIPMSISIRALGDYNLYFVVGSLNINDANNIKLGYTAGETAQFSVNDILQGNGIGIGLLGEQYPVSSVTISNAELPAGVVTVTFTCMNGIQNRVLLNAGDNVITCTDNVASIDEFTSNNRQYQLSRVQFVISSDGVRYGPFSIGAEASQLRVPFVSVGRFPPIVKEIAVIAQEL